MSKWIVRVHVGDHTRVVADRLFPVDVGERVQFSEIPEPVQAAIEDRLGSLVMVAESQDRGFSPGVAVKATTEKGDRFFIKAACEADQPMTARMHRREARIAGGLPEHLPSPRLLWMLDDLGWVVLCFNQIDGRSPAVPWESNDLARVLAALGELKAQTDPSPVELSPMTETMGADFWHWRDSTPESARRLGLENRRAELVELEAGWQGAVPGTCLIHGDLRADNIVLDEDRVWFVDWPHAGIGPKWVDLAFMLPSVAMQGGGDPEEIWSSQPLAEGVDPEALDAVLAALTGYFLFSGLQPNPPGLPTLRAFQTGQGTAALAWLSTRRGWSGTIGG